MIYGVKPRILSTEQQRPFENKQNVIRDFILHLIYFTKRRMVMIKLTWKYARYALSALATIGFGLSMN